MQVARDLGPGKRVVVILPDSIRNYMTKFVDDQWMKENGFTESRWETNNTVTPCAALPRRGTPKKRPDNPPAPHSEGGGRRRPTPNSPPPAEGRIGLAPIPTQTPSRPAPTGAAPPPRRGPAKGGKVPPKKTPGKGFKAGTKFRTRGRRRGQAVRSHHEDGPRRSVDGAAAMMVLSIVSLARNRDARIARRT